jgi:hypothetical protein
VLIEQKGSPVKCNRCLSGSWPALNHEGLLQRRADQLILLRVDRCHDVAHGGTALEVRSPLGDAVGEVVLNLI